MLVPLHRGWGGNRGGGSSRLGQAWAYLICLAYLLLSSHHGAPFKGSGDTPGCPAMWVENHWATQSIALNFFWSLSLSGLSLLASQRESGCVTGQDIAIWCLFHGWWNELIGVHAAVYITKLPGTLMLAIISVGSLSREHEDWMDREAFMGFEAHWWGNTKLLLILTWGICFVDFVQLNCQSGSKTSTSAQKKAHWIETGSFITSVFVISDCWNTASTMESTAQEGCW